VFITRH